MNRRVMAVGLLVAGIALAAWIAWPRRPPSDEERVRQAVEAMARAAEARDLGALLEHVSPRYLGEGGTRDELRGYLFGYLRGAEFVSVLIRGLEAKVAGDAAEARFRLLLTRVKAGAEVTPADVAAMGAHLIEAAFAREDGEWKVIRATRRAIGVGEALAP